METKIHKATLCDDDLYEVNSMYLWLPPDNENVVLKKSMLKKVISVDLLHRLLDYEGV